MTCCGRASTIPSNILRGCQSGTWSAGQEKIRGTYTVTKLQREHENENDKKKGTITQSTRQKNVGGRRSIERVWYSASLY